MWGSARATHDDASLGGEGKVRGRGMVKKGRELGDLERLLNGNKDDVFEVIMRNSFIKMNTLMNSTCQQRRTQKSLKLKWRNLKVVSYITGLSEAFDDRRQNNQPPSGTVCLFFYSALPTTPSCFLRPVEV